MKTVELHAEWGDGAEEYCEMCGAKKGEEYYSRIDPEDVLKKLCGRIIHYMREDIQAFEIILLKSFYPDMTWEQVARWVEMKRKKHYTKQAAHLQAQKWVGEHPEDASWLLARFKDE